MEMAFLSTMYKDAPKMFGKFQLKCLYYNTISKVKRQISHLEKIFVNIYPTHELIFLIYKESLQPIRERSTPQKKNSQRT